MRLKRAKSPKGVAMGQKFNKGDRITWRVEDASYAVQHEISHMRAEYGDGPFTVLSVDQDHGVEFIQFLTNKGPREFSEAFLVVVEPSPLGG